MAFGNRGISTAEKSETQSEHEDAAEDPKYNQAKKIETIAFPAQSVPEDAPAESGDQANLLENPDRAAYISHESSSRFGRSVPSWPTIERKISSSVVLLPASPEMPARNSSSEPCATSLPL